MSSDTPATPTTAYTVDQARDAVLAKMLPLRRTESIGLHAALGRVTANDIVATHNIPTFQNSAMDGFAVRYEDTIDRNRFSVAGTSLAGHPFAGEIPHGSVVKITTGAQLPPAADTIIIVENTSAEGDHIIINKAPIKNQYVRNPGDDIKQGEVLVAKQKQLGAADLGLLAAQGIEQLEVFKQPRIGVFSTGDELRQPGQKLGSGQIYDSNRITIQSLLRTAGFDSVDLGIARDNEKDLQNILENSAQCDFILSSGGVSVGEADFVKSVLEANGELFFWKVAMKPGKPMVTGKLHTGATYFGLPGNPVSSMVTCIQFVIPAIQAYSGLDYIPTRMLKARSESMLSKEKGRFEYQRGVASVNQKGELLVSTTGLQDSHVLKSMSDANCFICLDRASTGAAAGTEVDIILFDSLAGL